MYLKLNTAIISCSKILCVKKPFDMQKEFWNIHVHSEPIYQK